MAAPHNATGPHPPPHEDTTGDVVSWGSDDGSDDGPDESRRSPLTALALRLGTKEHHLTVGLAGAGAVLAGLSLLVSWQVTEMPAGRPSHIPATIETSLAGVDAWGNAYAIGLMGLLAAAALALFGSAGARRHARLAGLGWAAGLAGLLVAAAADLGNPTSGLNYLYLITSANQPQTSVGSGPFLALGGVTLVATALYLHGQGVGNTPAEPAEPVDAPARKADRPRRPASASPPPGGPVDLTVSEATPFVHLPEPPNRW